jgi:antitoxin component of MazEF toxin-antitoxin module
MVVEITKLSVGNKVLIPNAIRKGMGLEIGDSVTLVLQDNGEVRLLPQKEVIKHAQNLVRQFVPASRSLVDELLAER